MQGRGAELRIEPGFDSGQVVGPHLLVDGPQIGVLLGGDAAEPAGRQGQRHDKNEQQGAQRRLGHDVLMPFLQHRLQEPVVRAEGRPRSGSSC